jgi:hypothetical protein
MTNVLLICWNRKSPDLLEIRLSNKSKDVTKWEIGVLAVYAVARNQTIDSLKSMQSG